MGVRDVSREEEKVNVEGFVKFREMVNVPQFALRFGAAEEEERYAKKGGEEGVNFIVKAVGGFCEREPPSPARFHEGIDSNPHENEKEMELIRG